MATSTGQGNAQELEAGMVEGPSLDEPNAVDAEAAETPAPASPAPAAPLTTRSTLTSSGHEMDGTDGKPRPSEFAACRKIFLDLGANRATHIRKLFEPKKYKKSPYLPIFDKLFGSGTYRTQPSSVTGLCAFGFEANSRWKKTHRQIEKAYAAKGWWVKILNVAVGNTSGERVFYKNRKPNADKNAKSDWAVSRFAINFPNAAKANVAFSVPLLDFPTWLEVLNMHAPPGPRLVKMDIEGSEYEVLQTMMNKQLLCERVINQMTIEWHPYKEVAAEGGELKQFVMAGKGCRMGPQTNVTALDSEDYRDDGQPLP